MNTENIHNPTPAAQTRLTTQATATQTYVKPRIEVIAVENEGILASSAGSFGSGGGYEEW